MDYSQLTDEELLLEAKQLLEEVANRAEEREPVIKHPELNPYYKGITTYAPRHMTALSLLFNSTILESELNGSIYYLKNYIQWLEGERTRIEQTLGCDFEEVEQVSASLNKQKHWFLYQTEVLDSAVMEHLIPPPLSSFHISSMWYRYTSKKDACFGEVFLKPHTPRELKKQKTQDRDFEVSLAYMKLARDNPGVYVKTEATEAQNKKGYEDAAEELRKQGLNVKTGSTLKRIVEERANPYRKLNNPKKRP